MIIRSQSAGNIEHIIRNENKIAEPQTPPIVESEPKTQKVQEIPRIKRNGQENKKVNKKPVENNKKSAFEILMEED